MILLIDNYDSFTYNVYQYIADLGHKVQVVRNDQASLNDIEKGGYQGIVISPGPGRPDDAGICKEVVAAFSGKIPILGICLGHQVIGEVFGGKVIRGPEPFHGKASPIYHSGAGIYQGMPSPLTVGRYHSLIVAKEGLPECLEITAATAEGIIMGLRHKKYKVEGVQFHPESILTPDGIKLLKNFLLDL
jgi:anthranilate synthase/aminodeoxychorismate synthase-like glutamine amidotransferase